MPFGLLYCPNTGLLRCGQIRHFLCFSVNFLIPSIFRALFCRPKQTCVLQMQRVKMNPKYLQINPQENLSNSIKEERRTQQPTKIESIPSGNLPPGFDPVGGCKLIRKENVLFASGDVIS
ncbi:hypothetical protein ES332_D05G279800v1 [Gossypium tomentosum]|uniref:Uncharacterized protein n=1 Tax=Gossypium tomentosum TaxID=34277 RepID=A0A5D2L0D1_GOSTO|nr:hypothetical protein ES332_D05G279800v1 [Gossypium tomentosum]